MCIELQRTDFRVLLQPIRLLCKTKSTVSTGRDWFFLGLIVILSILVEEDLIFRDIPYFQLYAYCTHCFYFRNKKMQFNSRGLFTLHLCYIHLKCGEISHFIKKQNFFLTANNFLSPPNRIDICYVYQKGIWVRQNNLFWQTSKETMGGVRKGFFMVRIYCYALFL